MAAAVPLVVGGRNIEQSINEILRMVFAYLDEASLRSCRQVCKWWKGLIKAEFKKKILVKLTTPLKLRRFIEQMRHTGNDEIPFGYFSFSDKSLECDWFAEFFQLFGPCVEIMQIMLNSKLTSTSATNLMNILYDSTPNLNHLHFSVNVLQNFPQPPSLPPGCFSKLKKIGIDDCTFWTHENRNFYSSFFHGGHGTLEHLNITFEDGSSLSALLSALVASHTPSPGGQCSKNNSRDAADAHHVEKSKINTLTLNGKVEAEHLKQLLDLNLSLKYFSLETKLNQPNMHFLQQLLNSQQKTLKVLALTDYCECKHSHTSHSFTSSKIVIPPMEKLDYLYLSMNPSTFGKIDDWGHRFKVLTILRLNLKFGGTACQEEYHLKDFLGGRQDQVVVPCKTMDQMELQFKLTDSTVMESLCRSFPNLTTLKIQKLAEENLVPIWTNLTHLKSLVLTYVEGLNCLDSTITGLPRQQCEVLKSKTSFKSKQIKELEQLKTHPGISNLKNLERFGLQTSKGNSSPRTESSPILTDVSVHFGLLYLKCLQRLQVQSCQVSKKTCEKLIKTLTKTTAVAFMNIDISIFQYDSTEMEGRTGKFLTIQDLFPQMFAR